MDQVQIVKFIKTNLLRRGTGESKESPIRIIEQYWDFEGNLIFEIDSFPTYSVKLGNKITNPELLDGEVRE